MSAGGAQDFFEPSQPQRGTPVHSGYDGACDMYLAGHPDHADTTADHDRGDQTAETDLDDEIAELERLLERKRLARAQRAQTLRVAPVPREPAMVCTYQQEGLWFVHQLDPASSVYHIASALRLRGNLDVASLGRSLRALVIRHEALRTRFVEDGGVPRQVI